MPQDLAVAFECTPVREANVEPGGRSPAMAVIETVTGVEGVDPMELPPLSDAIDPDVIDLLVTPDGDSQAGLCFTYNQWNVFVRADGTIIIADPDEKVVPTPLF